MAFVHLHVHTEYSLLDGLPKIPQLVKRAQRLKMPALAITDHGVLYGAVEFYKECEKAKIKPIIGMEGYLAAHSRFDKKREEKTDRNHVVLLCQNEKGYKNLLKLSTLSHLEGFYYKPRMDFELLGKYNEGLICLTGCPRGVIPLLLAEGNFEGARKNAIKFLNIFGPKRFYLELYNHHYEDFIKTSDRQGKIASDLTRAAEAQKKVQSGLFKLSRELGVALVATNDVHYIEKEDAEAQDVLVCIRTNKKIADLNRIRYIDTPVFYLKSEEEIKQSFPDLPEAIENSVKIAQECNLRLSLGKWAFPDFDIKEDLSADDYLRKLVYKRIKNRVERVTPKIKERLDYELDVIAKKGYSSYFLIFTDLVDFARQRGILTNTRGSAAGSLVSYALGITKVNPIEFNLPFERFLNLYRPSPPDIDLDLADNRREEVILYLIEKYGQDKTAQICTFGRMLARQAVRDVGRALGMPYSQPDRIARMIPFGAQGFPMTIEKAKALNPNLDAAYKAEPETKKLLDLAQKVEGNARHASVHAAGIVISPTPLTDFVPLQREPKGTKVITQYEMHACEDVGLIKLDLLGIRNLSILEESVRIVEAERGVKINLSQIKKDDKKTFEILSEGATIGLFQLGGSGMTRYLKELKPTTIYDIMAMVALFRPGPMSSIPEFIRRKHNPKLIKYLDPRMKEILNTSYGVITYQDDVLMIAIKLAGYSWEEADKFRKAIGKKIPSEMAKQKGKFISGCIKNGLSRLKAERLFASIEPFVGYGFNKAHAASYAQVAYQTAYMKAHYPVEFMVAVLTAEAENTDKLVAAINECKRLGIEVLPPAINLSGVGFSVEKNELGRRRIRFGLSAIKNVGKAAVEAILKARKQSPFLSLADFCCRVDLRAINRKVLESLIKAGAMDQFGKRANMLSGLDRVLRFAHEEQKRKVTGQISLFDEQDPENSRFTKLKLPEVEELPHRQLLSFEKELLGFYLTEHPLTPLLSLLSSKITHKIGEVSLDENLGQQVKIGGLVTSVRRVLTKKSNSEMAFVKLEDDTGELEMVVFPSVYQSTRSAWIIDQVVLVEGRVDNREERLSLIAEKAVSLSQGQNLSQDTKSPDQKNFVEITVPLKVTAETLKKVQLLLKSHRGKDPVVLVLPQESQAPKRMVLPFFIKFDATLKAKLESLLDKDCVRKIEG